MDVVLQGLRRSDRAGDVADVDRRFDGRDLMPRIGQMGSRTGLWLLQQGLGRNIKRRAYPRSNGTDPLLQIVDCSMVVAEEAFSHRHAMPHVLTERRDILAERLCVGLDRSNRGVTQQSVCTLPQTCQPVFDPTRAIRHLLEPRRVLPQFGEELLPSARDELHDFTRIVHLAVSSWQLQLHGLDRVESGDAVSLIDVGLSGRDQGLEQRWQLKIIIFRGNHRELPIDIADVVNLRFAARQSRHQPAAGLMRRCRVIRWHSHSADETHQTLLRMSA